MTIFIALLLAQHQVSLATVIFVASQKALSAEVKAVIKQQLESVSNGWTVYRIARQASRMVRVTLRALRWSEGLVGCSQPELSREVEALLSRSVESRRKSMARC